MSAFTFKQANRRYHLMFWPAMAIYCGACIGGAFLQRMIGDDVIWFGVVLAVLTVLPIFVVLWLMWRYTREADEYTRVRQVEAMALGGLVTVGAAGLIGFLQIYEVIPQFPVFLILPAFFLTYGLSKFLRDGGKCD